jgi:acetyltransferase-like isoleucine patch superfamily enzyme
MKFSFRQKILSSIKKYLFLIKSRGNLTIGKNVHIGKGTVISGIHNLVIEDDVYIGKYCTIEFEGVIESKAIIANNVGVVGKTDHDVFGNDVPAFDADLVRDHKRLSHPTYIKHGSWIGYGAVVMSGVTIGKNAVVAAGSVVTKSCDADGVFGGNPAKFIRKRSD